MTVKYNGTAQNFWKNVSFTSYTGGINGKRVRYADGFIRPQPQNLTAMSQRFDAAYWTKTAGLTVAANSTTAPDGTTTGALFTANGGSSTYYMPTAAAITVTPNIPYTVSCYFKAGNNNFVGLNVNNATNIWASAVFDLSDGLPVASQTGAGSTSGTVISTSKTSVGNGWFRCSLTCSHSGTTAAPAVFTAPAASGNTFNANGVILQTPVSRTYEVWGAQLNAGSEALAYVPTTAHNLCLQSQTFDTTWVQTRSTVTANSVVAPDGTTTADTFNEDGTAANTHALSQGVTGVLNAVHTISIYAKANLRSWITIGESGSTGSTVRTFFNLSTGAIGTTAAQHTPIITDVGNGWYRCAITFTASNTAALTPIFHIGEGDNDITFDGLTQASLYVWGAQVELASSPGKYVPTTTAAVYSQHYDLPREWNTSAVCQGILVEDSRTNIALHSRDLTNAAWTATSVTTARTATGVDNIANTATTLTASGANGTVLQSITSASTARIFSAYVRRRTGTGTIEMTQDNGTTWVNVTTELAAAGTGWARVNTGVATVLNPVVGFRIVTNGDAIDVDMCQSEAGAFGPTSPIVTGSASVTRAGDNPLTALSVMPSVQTAGTLYVRGVRNANTGLVAALANINDGTINERVYIFSSAAYAPNLIVTDGGVAQASYSGTGTLALNGVSKAAASYALDDFALTLNGATPSTDTLGTLPTTTQLQIGCQLTGSHFNGYIQQVMLLPRAMSDTELQNLTA